MSEFTGKTGAAIRTAGKTTVFLQAVAVFLTFILIALYADISRRYSALESGIRENATWGVYQLDREARSLDNLLKVAMTAPSISAKDLKAISLRYDILMSRIKLLRDAKYDQSFLQDANLRGRVHTVEAEILGQTQFFDQVAKGWVPQPNDLAALAEVTGNLVKATEKFLLDTNRNASEERTEKRETIMRLQSVSAVMLGLLLLSIVFLVFILRRQLKSVREVSFSLEIMAHELTDAYKAADAGNRAKSQFMATMGHEIRTPLNAILGTAELLEFSRLPPDAAASVQTIRASGEALLEIINEILDYSKIEHGKLELEYRSVDILQLAHKTIDIVAGRAAEHGNQLVVDLPQVVKIRHVRTDPTRLRQVLLNLLSNAVKFTDKGSVTLRLREFVRNGQQMLRFEVEDTGIGIDEAGMAKLFQPFTQVDASISRKYGGTGLGLTICKQIIEQMGGELGLRSVIGQGSTFWFEIPVVEAENAEPAVAQPQIDAIARLPRGRVLLVEDNKVNQQVATRFLGKLGQDVVIANHGGEAVELALKERFDVILMDMQMPVMDGIEATRQIIASIDKVPPIIAMTANASDDDRQRCQEAGMVGFESKPVTLARLYAVMSTYLQPQQPEGALEEAPTLDQVEKVAVELVPPAAPSEEPAELLDSNRRQELIDALGEETFQELVDAFFEDAGALVAELHLALASEDAVLIDRVLHTIKGAASNIGLNDIATLAHDMRDDLPTIADVELLAEKINSRKMKLAA